MEPITVDTLPTPDSQPIPVDVGTRSGIIPSPGAVAARTAKAMFGIPDLTTSYDDLFEGISSGQELELRSQAAAKIDDAKNKKLVDAIREVSARKKGPLTEAEIRLIQSATGTDKPTNPNAVFESEYSKKYLDTLYGQVAPDKASWFEEALRVNYQRTNQEIKVGTDYLAKDNILQTAIDNVEALANTDSLANKAGNLMKDFITLGLRSSFVKRGNVPGVDFFEGLQGENQKLQGIELYRQSLDKFTEIVKGLEKDADSDPHLTLSILKALKGDFRPREENFWELFNLATLPGVGALGKGLIKAPFSTARAVKDLVVSSNSSEPVKVAAAVGVGDLENAAVEKVTQQVVADKQGNANPVIRIVQSLPRIFRDKAEAAKANPGNGPDATELTNRINLAYENLATNVENVTAKLQRVNRTPAPLADADTVQLIKDEVKQNYKGVNSRVLQIGDAVYVPHVNNYFWELQLGKHDGTLFKSPESATAAAIVDGIVLQGGKDAARQYELRRTIAQTEYELSYHRAAQEPSNFLPPDRAPRLEAGISSLEKKLETAQKELGELRASPGATIEQQGAHFYISQYVPYDETGKVTRSNLLTSKNSRPASGFLSEFMNSFVGWGRTGDETLSKDAMAAAKVALYGQNNLIELAKSELKEFNKLGRFTLPGTKRRQAVQELEETLKFGETDFNPKVSGQQGYLFDSLGELQDHFMRNYAHWASPQQVSSYFAAKRYGELQQTFHDIRRYTEEARQGAGSFQVRLRDDKGQGLPSPMFKGILRSDFKGDADGYLYIPNGDLSKAEIKHGQLNKELQEGVVQGRIKAVELLYPNDKPLKSIDPVIAGDHHFSHILTEVMDQHTLDFTRSEFRGGGMWNLDHPFYVKQAILEWDPITKTMRYKGDRTLMPMSNGTLGRDIVKHLEDVRTNLSKAYEGIKQGGEIDHLYEAAQTAAKKLPIEWQEHAGFYNESKDATGNFVRAKYSVDEPWQLVPGNSLISNMNQDLFNRMEAKYGKGKFKDDTRGNLIFRNIIKNEQDTFDLYTIRNEGTRTNPDYKYEPAKYIDPTPALNRGMRSIVNSVLMDDYRNYFIEHWIQQAKDHLEATPAQLAHAPEYYFYHGKYLSSVSLDVRSRLNDARQKAQGVWGTPSVVDNWIQLVSQHMYDSVYEGGPLSKLQMIPAWALAKSSDAAQAIRSLTYHATLGVIALPQFIVQNMGYVTIAGLEGFGHAGAGALAMLLHQYSRKFPQHIDALDKLASTFIYIPSVSNFKLVQFKPGQFKEANQGMLNTGFHLVGADNIIYSMSGSTGKVITSGGEQVLDLLSIPFKEGEKSLRYGAWYTAYLKYRGENPYGAISRQGWQDIFDRAELLSGSMSQASKSALQKGPMSFTTQFLGYNLRVVELMTGKRTTWQEKARLFSTYWALGGVSALGLLGFPAGDIARKVAVDNGYTENSDAWKTWAMEGLPSAALKMITGKTYNVGERYFSPGFTPIRDYMSGDKGFWQVMGGAATNNLANLWTLSDGYKRALLSIIRNEDTFFPMTVNDVFRPTKVIGSVNNFDRYMDALHNTNWMTRNGQKLDTGVTPLDATFRTITGLSTQAGSGTLQAQFSIEKDRKAYEDANEKSFLVVGRRWIQAHADNDQSQATAYGTQMRNIRQKIPPEKLGPLMRRLSEENKTLINRGNYDMYIRNVPVGEREKSTQTYRELQGLK